MIDTTIITTALQLHDPRFTCTGRLPVFEPGTDTRALNVSNSDVGGEMSVARWKLCDGGVGSGSDDDNEGPIWENSFLQVLGRNSSLTYILATHISPAVLTVRLVGLVIHPRLQW